MLSSTQPRDFKAPDAFGKVPDDDPLLKQFYAQYGEDNFKNWVKNNLGLVKRYPTYVMETNNNLVIYSPDVAKDNHRAFVADLKYKPLMAKIF